LYKPGQSIEAINHAKEAGVAIIVAITKIDKERADIDRVKGEMAAQGLQPEEWGGDIPFVLTSAVTKTGLTDLLDHILLISELKNYRSNPSTLGIFLVSAYLVKAVASRKRFSPSFLPPFTRSCGNVSGNISFRELKSVSP
jgi:predicted GTPase